MSNKITMIKIDEVYPHPDNPRKDIGDITEISASIKENGILQNLTVVPGHYKNGNKGEWVKEGYTTIIGHRRCAAAKEAGLKELPCVITEMSEQEQFNTMMMENMQREDLNVFEQAYGFQMMLNLGETKDAIQEKTGFSRSTIEHRLNIAKLDLEEIKKKENDNEFQMSLTDLYQLEKIESIEKRNEVLKKASTSSQLAYLARNAATEEKEQKEKNEIIYFLREKGIKKILTEHEDYSVRKQNIKIITLQEWENNKEKIKEEIEEIEDLNGKEYDYIWNGIRIISIQEEDDYKEETEEEKEEKIRKQKNEDRKDKLKAKINEISKKQRYFVDTLVNGHLDRKTAERKKDALFNLLLEIDADISKVAIENYYAPGGSIYGLKNEEKEKVYEQADKIKDNQKKMLIILEQEIEDELKWIVTYSGEYEDSNKECIEKVFKLYEEYGLDLTEEEKQIINGTHTLYTIL